MPGWWTHHLGCCCSLLYAWPCSASSHWASGAYRCAICKDLLHVAVCDSALYVDPTPTEALTGVRFARTCPSLSSASMTASQFIPIRYSSCRITASSALENLPALPTGAGGWNVFYGRLRLQPQPAMPRGSAFGAAVLPLWLQPAG